MRTRTTVCRTLTYGVGRRRSSIAGAERHRRISKRVSSYGLAEPGRLYQERSLKPRWKQDACVMGMIVNPSKLDFKGMVSGNMLRNCSVTTDAITNVSSIFCPNLASVRGKTVRRMLEQEDWGLPFRATRQ